MFKFFPILFILINVYAVSAQKQEVDVTKVYTTQRILNEEAPAIDGMLDEDIWNRVEWGGDFIELEPDENTPPHQQTKFKILYDDKFLYVAIHALDTQPDSIVRRLSRRDGFEGDRVNIAIDSYHDKRTAFIYTTTAAGVKGDEIATNNGEDIDDSYNPIWYTKSAIGEDGWTAEMKIPFTQLRFGKENEQIWGINIFRNIFRKNEVSIWKRIPAGSAGLVSQFGELHGLIDLIPQKQVEIQPFTVGQYQSYPEEKGNPFRDGSDFKVNAGLDAKIGITNDLTLDLTVNPDFGQVEADPAAIALDGFQIFFREQRPFFVENKNIFEFRFADRQDNLFYSRRIGRNPQGFSSVQPGEFEDFPQNTTILGAAKFSGKTKNGWAIGVLESVTAKEFSTINNNGEERRELVEPLTNYFIGRLQKDFNERNTFVGGMFTATNRDNADELQYLRSEAYTGGLDFTHQWYNREYYIGGNFAVSHVQGTPEAIENTQRSLTHLFQRVDASHVEVDPTKTSLTGTGGRLEGGRQGGGNWTYDGRVVWRSPELEVNDVGFLRQADDIRQEANVRYNTLKPFGAFRSLRLGLEQSTAFDFEGNYNRIQYEINGNIQTLKNWFFNFGAAHKPRIYSNTELRGGPRWRYSQENFGYLFVGTDERKKLRTSLGGVISQAKEDNFSLFRIEADVTYQPTNALRISISPEYSKRPSKTQYVTQTSYNESPRYIISSINNETINASIRVNYIINPNLSIQYYGQPFISRGRYSEFKYVTNPIAARLNDRYQLYDDNQIVYSEGSRTYDIDENLDGTVDYRIDNPNFSVVQFRSNLVLRWEYIPGSELFLVWSQGINGLADPRLSLTDGLDNQILNKQPENIFLLKATYRFVL
ncbi:Carbohydrate family 9 binding domain-like [Flavobacteriaceae bacterium MAR_2010_188]|nr:Carbohydrate family 9 binding domain-like [Flavobacteriaceae bacterium MAR_2010_188]